MDTDITIVDYKSLVLALLTAEKYEKAIDVVSKGKYLDAAIIHWIGNFGGEELLSQLWKKPYPRNLLWNENNNLFIYNAILLFYIEKNAPAKIVEMYPNNTDANRHYVEIVKEYFDWESLRDIKLSDDHKKLLSWCDKWPVLVELEKWDDLFANGYEEFVPEDIRAKLIKDNKNFKLAVKYGYWDWLEEWQKWKALAENGQFPRLAKNNQWPLLLLYDQFKIIDENKRWAEALDSNNFFSYDSGGVDGFWSAVIVQPNFDQWDKFRDYYTKTNNLDIMKIILLKLELWDKFGEFGFFDDLKKNNRFEELEKYGKMTWGLRIKRWYLSLKK